jgi:hypothetical protein
VWFGLQLIFKRYIKKLLCLWGMFLQDWFISTDNGQSLSQPPSELWTELDKPFLQSLAHLHLLFFKLLRWFYFHALHFKGATILPRKVSQTSSVAIVKYILIIFIYCLNEWLGKYFLIPCIPVSGSIKYLNICVRHWLQMHKYATFITAALLAYTNLQERIHLDHSCLSIVVLGLFQC